MPFRVVASGEADCRPYENCVPFTSLKAAAGSWSEEQTTVGGSAEQAEHWAVLDRADLSPGMFIAKVEGHSMEPLVPDGSYCLFRPVPAGSREGRKLLVWHAGVTDPESGGQYTLKVYHSEKSVRPDAEWQHEKIILKPLNHDYDPVVLEASDEEAVWAIAELVTVF